MNEREIAEGTRFAWWTVVEKDARPRYWACRCECGAERAVFAGNLTSGKSTSCGCRKLVRGEEAQFYRHGLSHSRAWNVWQGMKRRCYNERSRDFAKYGGRGIRVCDRWLECVENFVADMGEPADGMTIERIDVNGNYEPANCRWASKAEQNRNTRRNVHLTLNGKSQTSSEWARELKLNRTTIEARLKRGDSDAQALRPTS